MSSLRSALAGLPAGVFADLHEGAEGYLVVLDVAGATADTVEVSVEGRRVHVDARRAKEVPADFKYVQEDRAIFTDVELPLPPDATADGASASVERGVLEISLPKRAGRGRQVPVE